MHKFLTLSVFLLLVGCTGNSKKEIDVSGINANVVVNRFDEAFYTTTLETLPKIKADYPFLFPKQTNDSIWLARINDTEEQALFAASQTILGDFNSEKKQLQSLFKHIKYYFPKFKEPTIFTLLTLDYKTNVVYVKDKLFISLDSYLGRDNALYNSFPKYVSQNFDASHLIVDVADKIIDKMLPIQTHRTFLEKMVAQGKRMYLLDLFLPDVSDTEKMGYTATKMQWIKENEVEVWRYFIEKKLLFSTNQDLSLRFIKDAPFSKFYLSNDVESPGRVGVYIGWQMVKAYMNVSGSSVEKLLQANAISIFKKSRYKPKK